MPFSRCCWRVQACSGGRAGQRPKAERRRPRWQSLEQLALHAIGVSVVSMRRSNGAVLVPTPQHELKGGDTLVLSGLPEALALAEEKILRG